MTSIEQEQNEYDTNVIEIGMQINNNMSDNNVLKEAFESLKLIQNTAAQTHSIPHTILLSFLTSTNANTNTLSHKQKDKCSHKHYCRYFLLSHLPHL